jgi:hypothetical protein
MGATRRTPQGLQSEAFELLFQRRSLDRMDVSREHLDLVVAPDGVLPHFLTSFRLDFFVPPAPDLEPDVGFAAPPD